MVNPFSQKRSKSRGGYNPWQLVDSRFFDEVGQSEQVEQIICDIDKTYLETQFESFFKMAKIPFEAAADKVTVAGASQFLLALRWGSLAHPLEGKDIATYPRPLHFVSSSPPQLRRVMEEKLSNDGLDWTSDTFKNQTYNIRKGRFDLLKQQIAYKSAAILRVIQSCRGSSFVMVGDNAESDPFIYLGVKLFCERRLSPAAYQQYLTIGGVEDDVAAALIQPFEYNRPLRVPHILIRKLANYEFRPAPPLTDAITYFPHVYDAVLYLWTAGLLDGRCLWPLTRSFHNEFALDEVAIAERLAKVPPSVEVGEIRARFPAMPTQTYVSTDLSAFHALSEESILHQATAWMRTH